MTATPLRDSSAPLAEALNAEAIETQRSEILDLRGHLAHLNNRYSLNAMAIRFTFALANSSEIVVDTTAGPMTIADLLEFNECDALAPALYLAQIARGELICRPLCRRCKDKICPTFCVPAGGVVPIERAMERRYNFRAVEIARILSPRAVVTAPCGGRRTSGGEA